MCTEHTYVCTYVRACVVCTVHMYVRMLCVLYICTSVCCVYCTYVRPCVVCTMHIYVRTYVVCTVHTYVRPCVVCTIHTYIHTYVVCTVHRVTLGDFRHLGNVGHVSVTLIRLNYG